MPQFTDCAIYLRNGMGGITRINAVQAEVTDNVPSAQYKNATRLEYLEKGKRKKRGVILTYRPFLAVVAQKNAIDPDSGFVSLGASHGAEVSRSQYLSTDDRYVTDFLSKLQAAGVTPLYQRSESFGGE